MANVALAQPYERPAPPVIQPEPAGVRWLFLGVSACLLAGIGVAFFYGIRASPDVLRDEMTYWIISHNVAAHAAITLYGSPFVLHPPLVFLIEGAALKLTGGPNDFLYGMLSIRWLMAALGLATAILMLVLSTRSTGRLAGVLALALFGLDPLVLRTVRRDLLEAPAMFFTLIAVILLASSGERGLRRPALAGVAIGLALLCKEYTGFLLGLIVLQWLWPHIARRWMSEPLGGLTFGQACAAFGFAIAVYALYPLGWFITGHWSLFVTQKWYLFSRFLGIVHDTGLNRANTHVSFVQLLLINVEQYATSYALLAIGGLSGLWLLFRAERRSSAIVGLWAVVATIWSAFETVHGLAEEEFYYYAIIPCAITTGALIAQLVQAAWRRPARRRGVRALAAISLAALLGVVTYNASVWARYYASPDGAVLKMRQYVDHHLPRRTAIVAGSEMDGPSFANDAFRLIRLRGTNDRALNQYRILTPPDIRSLARGGAHYVIMSTKDVYIGYGVMSRSAARFIHAHGTVLYAPYSTTYWHEQLIRLHPDVWRHR